MLPSPPPPHSLKHLFILVLSWRLVLSIIKFHWLALLPVNGSSVTTTTTNQNWFWLVVVVAQTNNVLLLPPLALLLLTMLLLLLLLLLLPLFFFIQENPTGKWQDLPLS